MANIPMDSVSLFFTVEDFISTDKARVTVQINCSYAEVRSQTEVRTEIQTALAAMLDVDWRFLSLLRFTDTSGMERWEAMVEQRVEESKLSALRTKAKELSRQGMKLSVKDVSYEPVAEEYDVLYAALRQRLYSKIQSEVATLNSTFEGREFRVAGVNFSISQPDTGSAMAAPKGAMMAARSAVYATAAAASPFEITRHYSGNDGGGDDDDAEAAPGGFAISKKILMSANVTLSSVVPGFETFPQSDCLL